MLRNYYKWVEISQDVLNKCGNILVFNKNHFQCFIDKREFQVCKNLCEHTQIRLF